MCHFISQSEDKNKRYYGNFQSVCYFDCCDYAREWHPLSEMACIYAMINKAAGKSGEPQNQTGYFSPEVCEAVTADLRPCASIFLPRAECAHHQITSAVYQFPMAAVTNYKK